MGALPPPEAGLPPLGLLRGVGRRRRPRPVPRQPAPALGGWLGRMPEPPLAPDCRTRTVGRHRRTRHADHGAGRRRAGRPHRPPRPDPPRHARDVGFGSAERLALPARPTGPAARGTARRPALHATGLIQPLALNRGRPKVRATRRRTPTFRPTRPTIPA